MHPGHSARDSSAPGWRRPPTAFPPSAIPPLPQARPHPGGRASTPSPPTPTTTTGTRRDAARTIRIVHFVVGVVEVLIAMRFALELCAANSGAMFSMLLYGLTFPLVAPFGGVFANFGDGRHIVAMDALVAIVVYALIAWGLSGLLHVLISRDGGPPEANAQHKGELPPLAPHRDDPQIAHDPHGW